MSRVRVGDWMQVRSGGRFYPYDPDWREVVLDDIATALSRQCRFAGHTSRFYSVAEHSVYVSQVVPPEFALIALLHDATEAWCVDVPRPVKNHLDGYKEIERRIWGAVATHFGLPDEIPDVVKRADDAVLLRERAVLMGYSAGAWSIPGEPADVHIPKFWTPLHFSTFAKRMFMRRFFEVVQ